MELVEVEGREFDQFAINHKLNNLQQNSTWGAIEMLNNWEPHYLLFKKNNETIAGTLILIKKFMKYTKMYCPRGILIDYNDCDVLNEAVNLLKKFGKKYNAIYIKIEPYVEYQELDKNGNIVENGQNNFETFKFLTKDLKLKHGGFSLNKKYSNSRYISVLNIDRSIEEIENEYTSKCKNSIDRALDNFVDIHYFKKEELLDFYNCLDDSANYHEFYNPPLSYFEDLYEILKSSKNGYFVGCKMDVEKNKKKLEKLIAEIDLKIQSVKNTRKILKEYQNEKEAYEKRLNLIKNINKKELILCGAIFINIGDTCYYYISGAKREYLNFCAPYLLQREMIRKACESGCKLYNFLGISGIFESKHPRYGVISFKKNFNVDMIEFLGEFDIVTNYFGYYLNSCINGMKKIKNKLRKLKKR